MPSLGPPRTATAERVSSLWVSTSTISCGSQAGPCILPLPPLSGDLSQEHPSTSSLERAVAMMQGNEGASDQLSWQASLPEMPWVVKAEHSCLSGSPAIPKSSAEAVACSSQVLGKPGRLLWRFLPGIRPPPSSAFVWLATPQSVSQASGIHPRAGA